MSDEPITLESLHEALLEIADLFFNADIFSGEIRCVDCHGSGYSPDDVRHGSYCRVKNIMKFIMEHLDEE